MKLKVRISLFPSLLFLPLVVLLDRIFPILLPLNIFTSFLRLRLDSEGLSEL